MDDVTGLQIDHVEFFVPDRYEAAAWYQRVLGLEIIPAFEDGAANPAGPLMISSDRGGTKLALFEGQPQDSRPTAGFHRVAFRVSASDFMGMLQRLRQLQVPDSQGRPMSAEVVSDHRKAFSVYFSDPYGHRLEITTYDYDATRAALTESRSAD